MCIWGQTIYGDVSEHMNLTFGLIYGDILVVKD